MNQIRRFLAWCRDKIKHKEDPRIIRQCSYCTEWKRWDFPYSYSEGCSRKRIWHEENANECEFFSYMYQWYLDKEKKRRRNERLSRIYKCFKKMFQRT